MSTRPFLLIWLLSFVATDPLLAHSPMKGMGNFYSGLLHPVFVPAHLLLLTVLGLFIGQKGLSANRLSFAVFLLTTVIGLIGAWFSVGGELEIALLSLSVIIGLLLASNLPIGVYLSAIIAALVGILIGIDSAQDTLSGMDKLLTFLGTAVEINILFLYTMGFADYFNKKPWQKIGIRIIGSWIAASALLVIAFSYSN